MRRGLRSLVLAAATALLAGAVYAQPSSRGPAMAVCLLENNLPYSERASRTGFDHDVADAVARASGRTLSPVWVANATTMTEIDDGDLPLMRVVRDQCDALFSVAGPAAETLSGHGTLVLGEAYYGAAFEMLGCGAELPVTLPALRGHTLAIQSQSVAHFALLRVGAAVQNHFSFAEAFAAVVQGEAEAGLLWGPAVGWRLRLAAVSGAQRRHPELGACRLQSAFEPPRALRWNLHVATRASDRRLRQDIDTALAEMIRSGQLDTIKRAYGIPLRPPFSSTYSSDALAELPAAD